MLLEGKAGATWPQTSLPGPPKPRLLALNSCNQLWFIQEPLYRGEGLLEEKGALRHQAQSILLESNVIKEKEAIDPTQLLLASPSDSGYFGEK